jgi:hypothetical protein
VVTKKELTKIEEIVKEAWHDHFGSHPVEIRLEPGKDFLYGSDLVDVYIVFDILPAELGGPAWENFRGRKSLDFKGQIDEMMVAEELFIDTVYWYRQPEDFEPVMADG